VACEIIDGLNHHELYLFNAPRRDNSNITTGELIERYTTLTRERGRFDDVKYEAVDGKSEDDGWEVSPARVIMERKEADDSTMAQEDKVQEPINEVTRTLSTSPTKHTHTEGL